MKRQFKAAAQVVGWLMIFGSGALFVLLIIDVGMHVVGREPLPFHLWLWGVWLLSAVMGVLLVQTGEMAETLETMAERMPLFAQLASYVMPGGRREMDKLVEKRPELSGKHRVILMPEPPPPPPKDG